MVVPSVDYTEVQKSISTYNMEDMYREVNRLKELTAHIPVAARKESGGFEKAYRNLSDQGPNRGPKSAFFDPLSLQYAMGYKDRRYSLTYDVLKRCASQLSIVAAIINTRVAQIASFAAPYRTTKSLGFMIKHKDPEHMTTKSEREFIKHLEAFISDCGEPGRKNPYSRTSRDDFESFIKKIVRDTLTYDSLTFEVVPRNNGIPFEFLAVDASTIRIASTDRDSGIGFSYHARNPTAPLTGRFAALYENKQYGVLRGGGYNQTDPVTDHDVQYVQIVNGQIENVYSEDELAFGVRNPRTDIYIQGYGYGEIEQLITIVTSLLFSEEYNRLYFQQGSHPKGLLNFKGDNWTPDQLEAFRRQWISSVSGVSNCLAGDTIIWTNQGAVRIDEFLGDLQEKSTVIWTGKSWESALVYKTKEKKQLCKTVLKNGVSISTSPDHKIRVLGADGPEWRRQEDLQIGDYVLVNKKSPVAESIPSYEGQVLSSDMLEVLGWMTGDGYLMSKGKFNHFNLYYHYEKEVDIRSRHLEILQAFGLAAKERNKELTEEEVQEICERYNFHSVSNIQLSIQLFDSKFIRWLISIGFNPSRLGKVIPSFVYVLPDKHKAAFLRGFFSADGNLAKRRHPEISITNDRLREQTRLLLLSLGIRTSFSEGRTKLTIHNRERSYIEAKSILRVKDRDRFLEIVGFLQEHKQPLEMKSIRELGKTNRVDPATAIRYARLVQQANWDAPILDRRERMNLNSIVCGVDTCSLNRLIKYMEETGVEIPSWMNDYYFEPVVEKEDTKTLVSMFDVSVDHPEHMFVGNGVIESNSWKTPITQSEGIEWINLQMGNKDMEFSNWIEYLIKVMCGVYLIDPAEINFDMHGGVQQTPLFESSQEWKLKASRDRGLKPLLRFIAKLINKHVIDLCDDHFVFEFVGLDELTEQEKHEMLKEQIASYMTLNEARRSLDLPDIPLGDVPINPTYVQLLQLYNQNVQQQQQMAQQQQQQQMAAQQMPPGQPGAEQQPPPGAPGVEPGVGVVPGQAMAPGQPGQVEVPPGQGPVPGEQPSGSKYTANFGKSMREITVTFNDWIDQKRDMKNE